MAKKMPPTPKPTKPPKLVGAERLKKRDEFALCALVGLLAGEPPQSERTIDDTTGLAYRIADSMLVARETTPPLEQP